MLIERFFPDPQARVVEAGCGAGRVTLGLWDLGFREIVAFDFAEELVDQARALATERDARGIQFFNADATRLSGSPVAALAWPEPFDGALFVFNGLMQIPGRENRRAALREIASLCRHGAPFLFTTHDRNANAREIALWAEETTRWANGTQDPRLVDFGDRYFEDETGRTFMHLPDRAEILDDLSATGWKHEFDAMRTDVARESRAVRDFSDECRFWVARKV